MLKDGTDVEGPLMPSRERLQTDGQLPADLESVITCLAETIEADDFGASGRNQLRRMDYNAPDSPFFWQMMVGEGMPRNPDIAKWALIVKGMAEMAHGARIAHRPGTPIGQTLYLGRGQQPLERSYYSEQRLATLLSARGPALLRHLDRLFRLLANDGCSFDWCEMARFILNEGYSEGEADDARTQIARDYYRAQRRRSQQFQQLGERHS